MPEVGRTLRPDLPANQRGAAASAKPAPAASQQRQRRAPRDSSRVGLGEDDRRATRPTTAYVSQVQSFRGNARRRGALIRGGWCADNVVLCSGNEVSLPNVATFVKPPLNIPGKVRAGATARRNDRRW
jgi:hypothetical protein